jgi:uncharacterized protein (DUF302 family)
MWTSTPLGFDEAVEKTTAALAANGFGIITRIDLKATFAAKIGETVEPWVILGACNPKFAHEAVTTDAAMSLLLPCNVVVRQQGDTVHVGAIDPMTTLAGADGRFATIAGEVKARLQRAIESIAR